MDAAPRRSPSVFLSSSTSWIARTLCTASRKASGDAIRLSSWRRKSAARRADASMIASTPEVSAKEISSDSEGATGMLTSISVQSAFESTGDHQALHVSGAFEDVECLGIAIELLDGIAAADRAQRQQTIDGVCYIHGERGCISLGHRCIQ